MDHIASDRVPSDADLRKYIHTNVRPNVEFNGADCLSFSPYSLSCSAAPFPRTLVENMAKAGIDSLTPIQRYAMPCIADGRDLMGLSFNGSGKTAAYLLPIIANLMARSKAPIVGENRIWPVAFILVPHRQQVRQVMDECRKFAYNTEIECCGGTDENHERSALAGGCHILVVTPHCLNKYIEANVIGLDQCKFLVLDEADMLLNMEFEPEVRRIVKSDGMPSKRERQTSLFSAKLPSAVQSLASDFMKSYIFVTIDGGRVNEYIEQRIVKVDDQSLKQEKLLELLRQYYLGYNTMTTEEKKEVKKTIIFVERNRYADFLAVLISQDESVPLATSIHDDRFQMQWDIVLNGFKNGTTPILVATNVASRGLDVRGLHHVIIYDLPEDFDDYVRQIGRTGRNGDPGLATAFFDPVKDTKMASRLACILSDANQVVPDWLRALY